MAFQRELSSVGSRTHLVTGLTAMGSGQATTIRSCRSLGQEGLQRGAASCLWVITSGMGMLSEEGQGRLTAMLNNTDSITSLWLRCFALSGSAAWMRVAWMWVVWPMASASLLYNPPLEVLSVSGTPHQQPLLGLTGQELIHASRIISHTLVTAWLWVRGDRVPHNADNCFVHWTRSLQGTLRAQRVRNLWPTSASTVSTWSVGPWEKCTKESCYRGFSVGWQRIGNTYVPWLTAIARGPRDSVLASRRCGSNALLMNEFSPQRQLVQCWLAAWVVCAMDPAMSRIDDACSCRGPSPERLFMSTAATWLVRMALFTEVTTAGLVCPLAMGRRPNSLTFDAVGNRPLLSAWPAGHCSWRPATYRSLINSEAGLVAVTYTFRWGPTQRRDDFFLTERPDYCQLHLLLVRRGMSWICIGSFRNFQVHDWSFSIPRKLRGILSLGCVFAYLHSPSVFSEPSAQNNT